MTRTTSSIVSLIILCLLLLLGGAAHGQQASASNQPSATAQPADAQKPESIEQQDTAAKKNHTLRPLIDRPGTDCLNYKLDVMSLKANNVQMFWKQGDCIRVYLITNNPFLFKYDLSFNEQLIHEDDPLTSFGKIIGINVSGVSGTGTNSDTTKGDTATGKATVAKNASAKLAPDLSLVTEAEKSAAPKDLPDIRIMHDALSNMVVAGAQGDYSTMEAEEQKLDKGKQLSNLKNKDNLQPVVTDIKNFQNTENVKVGEAPENASTSAQIAEWQNAVNQLDKDAAAIQKTVDLVKAEYRQFSDKLPLRLKTLIDPNAQLKDVQAAADALQQDATQEFNCLTDAVRDGAADNPDNTLHNCPQSSNGAPGDDRTLEQRLVDFAHRSAALHKAIQTPLASSTGDDASRISAISDDLHTIGGEVVAGACTDKAIRDNDLASLKTGLTAPLNSVLTSGFSYGYPFPVVAKKREGPFGDPTGVTMTLTRGEIHPFATGSDDSTTPKNTTSSFTCSSDTTDMFDHGSSYNELNDFFTDKPVEGQTNTYTRNQNKPTPANQPTNQTAAQSGGANSRSSTKPATTPDNVVLVQPWFFGKARLVVSGGLSSGFLSKQEFQRSTSINGSGSSDTVIGLKTNTRFRITPMLYGHTLLYSSRHDPDAWYATLGVTANSDNKGTAPEFLLGLSRSFVQQRFFATAGAYIGEKQKLDGGLYVGEVIPSTLTTDLPTTKSYHVGFAIGFSYRFASTKDSQSNNSKQTPQQNTGTNQKKTTN